MGDLPHTSSQLKKLRKSIDEVDRKILEQLNRRAAFVKEIGRLKSERSQVVYVPSRERDIFERLEKLNPGPFPTDAIQKVFREIISASLTLERPLRVCYLGPMATFTHAATLKQFGQSATLVPEKSISAVFEEVEAGRANYGVVPIENSNEGAVTHTLDQFVESDLCIIAEIYLEISHDLLSNSGQLDDVQRIYSHPQAIQQCRRWLENHCPNLQVVEVSSTARAAQMVAEEEHAAAIAGQAAATHYGLKTIARKIEDNRHNLTRFLVIGRDTPEPTGRDKTSVLFSFQDQPGILSRMLEPFRKRNLNLAKIESRPFKDKAWSYLFFIDIEGHKAEKKISEALDDLREFCHLVKNLGSFPRAR